MKVWDLELPEMCFQCCAGGGSAFCRTCGAGLPTNVRQNASVPCATRTSSVCKTPATYESPRPHHVHESHSHEGYAFTTLPSEVDTALEPKWNCRLLAVAGQLGRGNRHTVKPCFIKHAVPAWRALRTTGSCSM